MKWKLKSQKSDDLVSQLLLNRGIKTAENKEKFFNSKLEDFEKSFQIPGLEKAKRRIEKAIKEGELIIAYGDYDVDGICGAAVLYLGLTKMGAKVLPYIPHREKEGYGISSQGLEFARDTGASLVISCDTGIVAFEMASLAKKLSLDLIITDHHQTLDGKLPDAFAIVHSLELCGTAVAWTLIRDNDLLDLVAIATVADMMPLIGVNRALVKIGLGKLNHTTRVGLLELFKEADLTLGQIGSHEIGHVIAPRLNAMGRLEHAIDSLRLLCTRDQQKARKLADLIRSTNEQRKILTVEAVSEAKIKINGGTKKIYVLSSKNWIPGIIGLIAARVVDETNAPTIAISIGEKHSKGSARSSGGVNIVAMIRKCEDLLVAVGGHPGAAGFTIETSMIDQFRLKMENLMEGEVAIEESFLEIEAEVLSSILNLSLVKELDKFEPFGLDNTKPILSTKAMQLTDLKTVGDNKHLKGKANGIDFIAFGMGDLINVLEKGQFVDVAFILEINRFNGKEILQLKVKDFKLN